LGVYLLLSFFFSGGYTLFFVFVCFNLYHHCHITFQGTLQIGCSLLQIFVVYFLLLFFFTNNGKFKIEITTFQYVVKMIIFYTVTMFWYQFLMIGEKSRQNKYWLHSVHLGTAAQKKLEICLRKKGNQIWLVIFFSETQKDLFRVIRVLKKTKKSQYL